MFHACFGGALNADKMANEREVRGGLIQTAMSSLCIFACWETIVAALDECGEELIVEKRLTSASWI